MDQPGSNGAIGVNSKSKSDLVLDNVEALKSLFCIWFHHPSMVAVFYGSAAALPLLKPLFSRLSEICNSSVYSL